MNFDEWYLRDFLQIPKGASYALDKNDLKLKLALLKCWMARQPELDQLYHTNRYQAERIGELKKKVKELGGFYT